METNAHTTYAGISKNSWKGEVYLTLSPLQE